MKIRVLKKVLNKQFCFIKCRKQYLWAVGAWRYSRITFVENTISNSPKVPICFFLQALPLNMQRNMLRTYDNLCYQHNADPIFKQAEYVSKGNLVQTGCYFTINFADEPRYVVLQLWISCNHWRKMLN